MWFVDLRKALKDLFFFRPHRRGHWLACGIGYRNFFAPSSVRKYWQQAPLQSQHETWSPLPNFEPRELASNALKTFTYRRLRGYYIFFINFQVAKEWFQNRVFSRPFNTPQFWVAHLQFSERDNACKWCSDLLFNFVADEASTDGANKETKVSSKIVQPPNTVTYTVSGKRYYTESQTWPFFCAAFAAAI